MAVIVIESRDDLIIKPFVGGVDGEPAVGFKKSAVLKIMKGREHRAVFHVMPVEHRDAVGKILFIAELRINRAGIAVRLLKIVVDIEVIVVIALQNGVIDIGVRDLDPDRRPDAGRRAPPAGTRRPSRR